MHTLQKVLVGPGTAEFVLGVLGPCVDGPLEVTLDDVDEARFGKLVPVLGRGVQRTTQLLGCFHEEPIPLGDGRIGGQAVVVRGQGIESVEELNVAAGVEVPCATVNRKSRNGIEWLT